MAKSRTNPKASQFTQVLNQARESFKLLEVLEKETIARAKTFVRNPLQTKRKEKIFASLKSLGVATRSEVTELERKVELLTQELTNVRLLLVEATTKQGKNSKTAAEREARLTPSGEAFPNT